MQERLMILTSIAFIGVIFYLFVFLLIQKGAERLAFVLTYLELICISLVLTYMVGDYSGFSLYCVMLVPISYQFEFQYNAEFYDKKPAKIKKYTFALIGIYIIEQIEDIIVEHPYELNNVKTRGFVDILCYYNYFFVMFVVCISCFVLSEAIHISNSKMQDLLKDTDYEANHDLLTGLRNRRYLRSKMEYMKKNEIPYALILCDIDFFKGFNDQWGHDCGDFVLRATSKCIKRQIAHKGNIYRYGGEEFMIVINENNLEAAENIAEGIRKAVEQNHLTFDNRELKITMTFGVSWSDGRDYDTVTKEVDARLYHGKEIGRNCVVGAEL